ncbi:MAG: peptide chain release factor N(5)-glutamine methyltransferase [Thermodesulfobacteriota bacterium]
MRIGEFLTSAAARLIAAGIDGADLEAALLLGHFLGQNRASLLLHAEKKIPPSLLVEAEAALARRLRREPLAYILGEQEFWSRSFAVSPAVLIPRPETEIVVECALEFYPHRDRPYRFLDLGTGSGILAIVLACEFPACRVIAVDRSRAALAIAIENARRHGVADRVTFLQGDWLGAVAPGAAFDLVVSNPPYIAEAVMDTLMPEVRDFEPHTALDGGKEGMRDITLLAGQVAGVLKPDGWLFMEIGFDQGELALKCFVSTGKYDRVEVRPDYAGLPRALMARRRVND